MKNIAIVIISAFLIMSCSACNKQSFGEKTQDYNHLLNQFNDDLKHLGFDEINFSETNIMINDDILTKYNADAVCHKVRKTKDGIVYISVSHRLEKLTRLQQRFVIYHEIGHCFYGLEHQKSGLMTSALGTLTMTDGHLMNYLREMLEEAE